MGIQQVCEVCGKEMATLHFWQIQEPHTVRVMHLCKRCHRESAKAGTAGGGGLSKKLVDMLAHIGEAADEADADGAGMTCPSCGLTYEGFRDAGRLGCAACYDVFSSQLAPLLDRIHRSDVHHGKIPDAQSPEELRRRDLRALRHQLHDAVSQEDFALAAQIRDRIRGLEAGIMDSVP